MPSQQTVELTDLDLATIPFHVEFQQILDLFQVPNQTALATITSKFQKCVRSANKPEDLSAREQEILRKLDLSPSDIASAEREFEQIDSEKLARRTRFVARSDATSPSWPRKSDRA